MFQLPLPGPITKVNNSLISAPETVATTLRWVKMVTPSPTSVLSFVSRWLGIKGLISRITHLQTTKGKPPNLLPSNLIMNTSKTTDYQTKRGDNRPKAKT